MTDITSGESVHLVNGRASKHIPVMARSAAYGDGLFETIRVERGRVHRLQAHLQRVRRGCVALRLPQPDFLEIQRQVDRLLGIAPERAVLKLVWYRRGGARGYTPSGAQQDGDLVLSVLPWPEQIDRYRQRGMCVCWCRYRLGIQPALAGYKHLNRLDQVLASAELGEADEGVVLDLEGAVVGGTRSNLFIVRDRMLLTPAIDRCGVRGVMRSVVLAAARDHGFPSREQLLYAEDVRGADEIFMTNALMGVVSVTSLGEVSLGPGSVTGQFAEWTALVG